MTASLQALMGTARLLTRCLVGLAARRRRPVSCEDRLAMLPSGCRSLRAPVEIRWNRFQVPFLRARSDRDLAIGLGVVHAHLRLFQMEAMRRMGWGRTAELLGPVAIDLDHSLRIVGLSRPVDEIAAMLPEETREWLEGFVDGINAVIENARDMPEEFAVLGVSPQPWELRDVLALGRLAASDFSWVVWRRLLPFSSRDDWPDLWRRLMEEGAPVPSFAGGGFEATFALLNRGGSNSFAVAGRRSAGGGALIASDPHLGLVLPNLWLIAGLRSPSYHAVGLMIPGVPVVALGRNRRIAWGGTSLHAASSDLFDLDALPDVPISIRRESIAVRWGQPRSVAVRETAYGPIVSDAPILRLAGRRLALRWIGHLVNDEITAMLRVARAGDWQAYRDALEGFAVPAQSMTFADREGRVGQAVAAHLPRRPSGTPQDIVCPPAALAHWDDIVTGRAFPSRFDPPEGFVASANNRPEVADVPIGFFFSSDDRVSRIAEVLRRPGRLEAGALHRLQRDVAIPRASRVRDRLLALAQDVPAAGRAVVEALRDWDGRHDPGSRGALALELLVYHLLRALHGRGRLPIYAGTWDPWMLLERDLASMAPERLRRALTAALPRAARSLRPGATWGDFHRLRLAHVFGRLPGIGRAYRFVDDPVGGGNDSLMKTSHGISGRRHAVRLGAVCRHVSDLGDPDANDFVLLGGQDGWLGSESFLDQYPLWRRGGYIRVPMRPAPVRAAFPIVTVLAPARRVQPRAA